MLKKLYAFIRIDSKLKAMLTHFPSIEESWKVMAYIDHAGRPCRMLSLLQWWLQVATVYEAILGYPRSNLKRHWTTLNYGQTPKKAFDNTKNTKGLHSQRCSDWLSPPSSGWPQVTTRPSAKIAANAKWVLSSLQTSLSKCWTRWLSPPIASLFGRWGQSEKRVDQNRTCNFTDQQYSNKLHTRWSPRTPPPQTKKQMKTTTNIITVYYP